MTFIGKCGVELKNKEIFSYFAPFYAKMAEFLEEYVREWDIVLIAFDAQYQTFLDIRRLKKGSTRYW